MLRNHFYVAKKHFYTSDICPYISNNLLTKKVLSHSGFSKYIAYAPRYIRNV